MSNHLSVATAENIEFMIEDITRRLKMAAVAALRPDSFDLEQYEDIKDIYDLVSSKSHYSINEMEAIVTELGKLRKS
jgi:uncharacterized protein YfkK (UPF0435 family)